MEDFLNKFKTIGSKYHNRMRFLFILDIIIIFSIFHSIFIIIQLEHFLEKPSISASIPFPISYIIPSLSFILALIGSLLLHRKDNRINLTLLVEKKYPFLNEKLRTAYDNRNEANVIVDSLKALVFKMLNKISVSKLISSRKIAAKILIAIIFIAGASTIMLEPEKYHLPESTLDDISNIITGNDNNTELIVPVGKIEDLEKTGIRGNGTIFGKPKIESIQGKNIDVILYQGSETGFTVKDTIETQNQFIKSVEFPIDIIGSNVSDGGYSLLVKKTEIEKQLINRYAVERSKI